MFREKRRDTLVRSVEIKYGLDLNVRGDAALGSLLERRGFSTQSQLLKACRGRLDYHPRRRRAFVSFHSEDSSKVKGFRLMLYNPALDLDVEDSSSRSVRSRNTSYIKTALRQRIEKSDILICVVGNSTAWREWVDWEISTAIEAKVPVCGLRIPETYGRFPQLMASYKSPVAEWNSHSITSAIEMAIARGI